jgi:hypothetical protein
VRVAGAEGHGGRAAGVARRRLFAHSPDPTPGRGSRVTGDRRVRSYGEGRGGSLPLLSGRFTRANRAGPVGSCREPPHVRRPPRGRASDPR